MADLHILRDHAMGLVAARTIALQWAQQAEKDFGMACSYEQGTSQDILGFTRSGVSGTLTVTGDRFDLTAKLGFLLGAFKEKIEAEITKNLDALLSAPSK